MSEEIPQLVIDTQWDTTPRQDPLYYLTSPIWSLSIMNWQIICTDLEGSLVLHGVVILTHPCPDFAVHWVIAWECHGYWVNNWARQGTNPSSYTMGLFMSFVVAYSQTSQPQIKICLQVTLPKFLSISKPFNFTTVSEWLRFFYSHGYAKQQFHPPL